jgi:hypothetical protein
MNEKTWNNKWPLERVLFAMAGTLVLAGSVLAAVVSPWFLILPGFVALNMLLFAFGGFCGASLLLSRFAGLQPSCAMKVKEVQS